MYVVYESIMFRFFYGDKINARENLLDYASPIANILYDNLKYLNNQKTIKSFANCLPAGKYYALNFSHVDFFYVTNKMKDRNTIELRCPNGTIEEVIWQNNINTFAKLILKAKSRNLDEEFLNYKIKKGIIDSESQFYIYNEIRLKIALEFVDLVFYNNLDKIYFLKQYLKGFEDNYNVDGLVFAKKFVK